MTLSANIRQFRKEKGLSQEFMADRLCMSQPTYNRLERNDYTCAKRLVQLADALGTTPDTLQNYHLTNSTQTETADKDQLLQEQQVRIDFLSRYVCYLQATWQAYGKGNLAENNSFK